MFASQLLEFHVVVDALMVDGQPKAPARGPADPGENERKSAATLVQPGDGSAKGDSVV